MAAVNSSILCMMPIFAIIFPVFFFVMTSLLKVRIHPCETNIGKPSQIQKFMGTTWGPLGPCRPQMGPMLAPWTLLSGLHCWTQLQTWLVAMQFSSMEQNPIRERTTFQCVDHQYLTVVADKCLFCACRHRYSDVTWVSLHLKSLTTRAFIL